MATPKLTLTVQLMHANARIAELEAKLAASQRLCAATQSISDLHHALRAVPAPIVTRFTRADGSVWEKTRIGNRATMHQVLSN